MTMMMATTITTTTAPQLPLQATACGVETGSNREGDRMGDHHHHQDGRMMTMTMTTTRGATTTTVASPSTAVSNCSQSGNRKQWGGEVGWLPGSHHNLTTRTQTE